MELGPRLRALATQTAGPDGSPLWVISLDAVEHVAEEMRLSRRQVEIAALQEHVLPMRYLRSLGTVGWDGQLALLQSTVGIVGAGGLGGWIIEGLARMGVGRLIIIDGDVFEENNLNRQALCVEHGLGKPKVLLAQQRVAEVNAAVEVVAYQERVDEARMVQLLQGANVIVDALDALPTRLELQRAARKLCVPLVHGAIAGYVGQVMTIFPDDPGLLELYGGDQVPEHGIEAQWGNPAATPMMIAAWEIQEVVKLLTGRGKPLRRRLLFLDGELGHVDVLEVSVHERRSLRLPTSRVTSMFRESHLTTPTDSPHGWQ
ncbi:MAG: HesA/MoeB/ThiF family protein [Candidatus Hadarchaeum sp.]